MFPADKSRYSCVFPYEADYTVRLLFDYRILRRQALGGCASNVLMSHLERHTERTRGTPDLPGVIKKASPNRHQISLTLRDDPLGMRRIPDQSNAHGRNIHCTLDSTGERHLISGF